MDLDRSSWGNGIGSCQAFERLRRHGHLYMDRRRANGLNSGIQFNNSYNYILAAFYWDPYGLKKILIMNHFNSLASLIKSSASFWETNKDLLRCSLPTATQVVFVKKLRGLVQKVLSIYDNHIQYSNKKLIHYRNCFLERAESADTPLLGYRLVHESASFEFYTANHQSHFIRLLKKRTIQRRFKSHFSILKKIKSSTVNVYKIRNTATEVDYAAKVYPKTALDHENLSLLLKEIAILQTVDHPNIVQLRELFETSREVILIFDYYHHGTLADVYKGKIVGDSAVSKILKAILRALVYLDSLGIVHRDVKPENIMLLTSDPSSACLIDLGLSDYYRDGTYEFPCCGTPGYIAPEMLFGRRYNSLADVYSLGIVAYSLTTGSLPFQGPDYEGLLMSNRAGFVDFSLLKCSTSLKNLIRKMIEYEPAKRWTAIQAFESLIFKPCIKKLNTECRILSPRLLPSILPRSTSIQAKQQPSLSPARNSRILRKANPQDRLNKLDQSQNLYYL